MKILILTLALLLNIQAVYAAETEPDRKPLELKDLDQREIGPWHLSCSRVAPIDCALTQAVEGEGHPEVWLSIGFGRLNKVWMLMIRTSPLLRPNPVLYLDGRGLGTLQNVQCTADSCQKLFPITDFFVHQRLATAKQLVVSLPNQPDAEVGLGVDLSHLEEALTAVITAVEGPVK